MAKYRVKSPDGKSFDITAPDNASQADVLNYAKKQWASMKDAPKSENLSGDVGKATKFLNEKIRGFSPDVDYDTGASFMTKWMLQRADNPREAQLALEHLYGPGNTGQDEAGRWWVKINGKKTEVFGGGGGVNTFFRKMGTDVLAASPMLAGAVGGAGAASEGGPIGMALGAGAGGMAGKALDDMSKRLIGFYAETPHEEINKLGQTAIINSVFEGMGPAAKAVLKPIMPWLRVHYFGVTPESSAMTQRALSGGAVPPVATALPGAKTLAYDQGLRNAVMGNPSAKRNQSYIEGQLVHMLEAENIPAAERAQILKQIRDPDTRLSTTKPGESLVTGVKTKTETLEAEAKQAMATARNAVDHIDKLTKKIGAQDPGRLGADVPKAISDARRDFGTAMSRGYDHADELTGGQAVVPTFMAKKMVEPIIKALPETQRPALFSEVANLPDMITLKDAHRLRTKLRDAASKGGLTPGLTQHDFDEVARGVDISIGAAARYAPQAVGLLRTLDKEYALGIAKFRDTQLNAMVNRMRTGIVPDPSEVAGTIIREGESERLNTIWGMASPELRRRIASADMANILREARGTGKNLLDAIEERGKMFDTVYGSIYGKQFVADVRKYAKELAAIDGKVEVSSLNPGVVASSLKTAVEKTNQLDTFVNEHPLAALRNPKTVDRAVRDVLRPGQETKTKAVMDYFGPESKEWGAVKRYALMDLLGRAFVRDASGNVKISGETMKNALRQYTRGQLDILFPHGLEEDIRAVADDANFLFPLSGDDTGMSLAAASIKGKIPFSIGADLKYLWTGVRGWISNRPGVIRALATIQRSDLPREQKLRIVNLLMRSAFTTGPGSGSPPPERPQGATVH